MSKQLDLHVVKVVVMVSGGFRIFMKWVRKKK